MRKLKTVLWLTIGLPAECCLSAPLVERLFPRTVAQLRQLWTVHEETD